MVLKKAAAGAYGCACRLFRIGVGRIIWFLPALGFLRYLFRKSQKRLLCVYDLGYSPYQVGAILILVEAALILRLKHQLEMVDYCFVVDPQNPNPRIDKFPHITSQTYHEHLAQLVSLVLASPYVGSVFVFDAKEPFRKFISDNVDRYLVWPSLATVEYRDQDYLKVWGKTANMIWDLIANFYLEKGFIPHLSVRPVAIDWANGFITENILPDVPITVNLRRNLYFDVSRNSDYPSWIEFFKFCEDRFPAKFIVIGTVDEIDNSLRNLSNVILAKDHGTNLEQDLALIQCASMYMGATSGISSMAFLNAKPYLIFNYRQINSISPECGKSYIFANEWQRLIWEPESTAKLIEEFTDLFESVILPKGQMVGENSTDLA